MTVEVNIMINNELTSIKRVKNNNEEIIQSFRILIKMIPKSLKEINIKYNDVNLTYESLEEFENDYMPEWYYREHKEIKMKDNEKIYINLIFDE